MTSMLVCTSNSSLSIFGERAPDSEYALIRQGTMVRSGMERFGPELTVLGRRDGRAGTGRVRREKSARRLTDLREFWIDGTSAATPTGLPSILSFADHERPGMEPTSPCGA